MATFGRGISQVSGESEGNGTNPTQSGEIKGGAGDDVLKGTGKAEGGDIVEGIFRNN